jgi:hypothetical protein
MKKQLFLIIVSAFISGCGIFLSPFNQQSYQYFIELKVLHIKFIETFTEDPVKLYDRNKVEEFYDIIDLKFREAVEYQKQIAEDETRLTAFNILREEFESNYNWLVEKETPYRTIFSQNLLEEISENYNSALKGELSRRNSNE